MKKRYAICFLLIVCFCACLLSGCGTDAQSKSDSSVQSTLPTPSPTPTPSPKPTATPVPQSTPQIFEDTELAYQLSKTYCDYTPPQGFSAEGQVPAFGSGAGCMYANQASSNFDSIISLAKKYQGDDFDYDITKDHFADVASMTLMALYGELDAKFKTENFEKTEIDGWPAYIGVSSLEYSGGTVQFAQAYINTPLLFTITYLNSSPNDDYLEDFLASVKDTRVYTLRLVRAGNMFFHLKGDWNTWEQQGRLLNDIPGECGMLDTFFNELQEHDGSAESAERFLQDEAELIIESYSALLAGTHSLIKPEYTKFQGRQAVEFAYEPNPENGTNEYIYKFLFTVEGNIMQGFQWVCYGDCAESSEKYINDVYSTVMFRSDVDPEALTNDFYAFME